jgi:hypothetical protein
MPAIILMSCSGDIALVCDGGGSGSAGLITSCGKWNPPWLDGIGTLISSLSSGAPPASVALR